ncbi:MAG TPA: hypothetical protein VF502_02740 [Stellaceae bacterium]
MAMALMGGVEGAAEQADPSGRQLAEARAQSVQGRTTGATANVGAGSRG